MRNRPSNPPETADQLLAEISGRYSELSNRLQQIARYVVDHPNDMAMDTIQVIADRSKVPPSAFIRFAKFFAYSGFSEMQRVFRVNLRGTSASYSERARQSQQEQGNPARPSPEHLLREFSNSSRMALEHLESDTVPSNLRGAIKLLAKARIVHVAGQRRSFPVASYLAYALNHSERPAHLLDGAGGMLKEQLNLLTKQDALVAISFSPYAAETAAAVSAANSTGAKVIAITDSSLSPIAQHADICFEVQDAKVRGFRSLGASMCLAQVMAVSLALDSSRRNGYNRRELTRVTAAA